MLASTIPIVKFCAEEIARQRDSPVAVAGLYDAWVLAYEQWSQNIKISLYGIENWGVIALPEKNRNGFRTDNLKSPKDATLGFMVRPEMIEFCLNLPKLDPEAAYWKFQKIHPFRDGNGRVGKILYNYMRGSLYKPELPPNFFKDKSV